MLNVYGYSEEALVNQVKAEDDQEVADEIAERLADGSETVIFENEIVL